MARDPARRFLVGITRRHVWGTVLFLASMCAVVWLGVLNGADEQPTKATSALLVVVAGGFQYASASTFYRIGRADPALARASVRRLIAMVRRAHEARLATEHAFETSTSAADTKRAVGRLSVEMSWIEEGLTHAIEDWTEVHNEELRVLTEGSDDDGTN